MTEQKNYIFRTFTITLLVILMMLGLSFVPGFRLGKVFLKHTNILSDVIDLGDSSELLMADPYFDTTFLGESRAAASPDKIDSVRALPVSKCQDWRVSTPSLLNGGITDEGAPMAGGISVVPRADELPDSSRVVPIEDFSDGGKMMGRFYKAISKRKDRPVRIAVLGDSFIEGDIITADVRERLQTLYGGDGVGFVPFSSPVAQYRGSVKHTFSGWKTYNVLQKRQAPETVRDRFFVSGYLCVPEENATVHYEGVGFRKHLKVWSSARLLFVNQKNSVVHVTVNDSINRVFTPESSPYIQQINVSGDIRKMDVKITGVDGFVGYGAVLSDQTGIGVDNYSLRGNSGMALFGTSSAVNTQIDKILGYDLVVLQYGLNVMTSDATNFTGYGTHLGRIIDYMKDCFPNAAILVMSVGDRSTQRQGQLVTMPSVRPMVAVQRAAAERCGVAFWNTFEAMGGEGGMITFVRKGWAAKDYTHIGYPGGRFIAGELVNSLLKGKMKGGGKSDSRASVPAGVGERTGDTTVFIPNIVSDSSGR